MLEINQKDFRFRRENDDILLGYNVITNKMFFFKGNTKKYIEAKLNHEDTIILEDKYMKYLLNNKILIEGDQDEI